MWLFGLRHTHAVVRAFVSQHFHTFGQRPELRITSKAHVLQLWKLFLSLVLTFSRFFNGREDMGTELRLKYWFVEGMWVEPYHCGERGGQTYVFHM